MWRVRSEIRLTVSFRCSGNKSFSCAMHSLILSRLFFSISLCGNLYVSCGGSRMSRVKLRLLLIFFFFLSFTEKCGKIQRRGIRLGFTLLSSRFMPLRDLNI